MLFRCLDLVDFAYLVNGGNGADVVGCGDGSSDGCLLVLVGDYLQSVPVSLEFFIVN